MGPVSAEITIDSPRERVFEVIADLANRPAFCDHFAHDFRLQRLESRGVGAAARFRVDAKRFPIWMETVVIEEQAPYRLLERGRGSRSDRLPINTAWELVEGPGSTTEVTVTFWAEPANRLDAVRGKLGAGRWYGKQWKRALRRLRDKVEGEERIEPLLVAGASRIGSQ
jgi:uncharacterized protein YndB with AHSA1/START domain